MLRRIRKSSGQVTLVLIGVAALAGCSEQRRDLYASREDCLADWGNKPEDCTPAPGATSGTGVHLTRYYGPSYNIPWWRGSSSYARGTTPHSMASHSVSRGGFGSTGHASSGG